MPSLGKAPKNVENSILEFNPHAQQKNIRCTPKNSWKLWSHLTFLYVWNFNLFWMPSLKTNMCTTQLTKAQKFIFQASGSAWFIHLPTLGWLSADAMLWQTVPCIQSIVQWNYSLCPMLAILRIMPWAQGSLQCGEWTRVLQFWR